MPLTINRVERQMSKNEKKDSLFLCSFKSLLTKATPEIMTNIPIKNGKLVINWSTSISSDSIPKNRQ